MENHKNWKNAKNGIFFTDLDNTMIFSYKHDIGTEKVNVELYQGREISYVTKKTYQLLKQAADKMLLVPLTTRTLEQYHRIDLGLGILPYALVCNGGVLLENGKENENWYKQSLHLVQCAGAELQKALTMLECDRRRIFELRFIRKLFAFTKCNEPEEVVSQLKTRVDLSVVDVLNNGSKIYVVPKALQKGEAVKRLKRYIIENIAKKERYYIDEKHFIDERNGCIDEKNIINEKNVINKMRIYAAGDSEFDISMLKAADIALIPKQLAKQVTMQCANLNHFAKQIIVLSEKRPLSDEILEYIVKR